jgi:hypothetical protein
VLSGVLRSGPPVALMNWPPAIRVFFPPNTANGTFV